MLYKDYEIENYNGAYMVIFCGDEIIFETLDEATAFIDSITE